MARLVAALVISAMLGGSAAAATDPMTAQVLRVERDARASLARLGKAPEPLARRCLQAVARRASRLVARVRPRPAGARSWEATVTLTRAYVEAVILGGELRRCRDLVGLTEVRSGTRVQVEIDPSLAGTDPTEPGWPRR